MKNVFLYLYPIEEYTKTFLRNNDQLYEEFGIQRPLPILNKCIQRRYRDNGYQVVFVLYPDKEIFGITPDKHDRILYTDILFSENSAVDENGEKRENFTPKYPNEQLLINQLGEINQLVIGGYHFSDCVRRVGDQAINNGINTLIDLDMTDLFFYLYKQKDYFDIDRYSPKQYQNYIFNKVLNEGESIESIKKYFSRMYSSPAYGFDSNFYKVTHK